MGIWIYYFFAKFYLYYYDYINFNVAYNLAFALFLLAVARWAPEKRAVRLPLTALNLLLGTAILWSDSWLPSMLDAYALVEQQGLPSNEYLINFVTRSFDPNLAASAAVAMAALALVNRFLKLGSVVVLVILLILPAKIYSMPPPNDIKEQQESFFDAETARRVYFDREQADKTDFDVVVLHVCSLAWDDLDFLEMRDHPFFKRFDFLFTAFNSATAYSGPSALRLMRGNCGQAPHTGLYEEAPGSCYTFHQLDRAGFDVAYALNHDGKYGDFAADLARLGDIDRPFMDVADLPVREYMFDDSPIYADGAVLDRWWRARLASDAPRSALYYNTVSLHDGSHWAGEKEWWKRHHAEMYKEFLGVMLGDMGSFLDTLESSGRRVVVILVPEHGAALRGSRMQPSGMRDVPLPQITNVPVGVKLIGPKVGDGPTKQIVIGKPTSYLALTHMLSAFIERNPFEFEYYLSRPFHDSIPITDFMAENYNSTIFGDGVTYYYFGKERKWLRLSGAETGVAPPRRHGEQNAP
jgi:cellulose synthase operon protein YhjU